MTLYNNIKKKKLAPGGTLPEDPKKGLSSAIGLASGIGGGLIDAFGKGDTVVGGTLKSGLNMAAAGASVGGPLGAAIGGGLGLVTGAIGSIGAKQQQRADERLLTGAKQQTELDMGQAEIASDPTIVNGRRKAEYFQDGGKIKRPFPKDWNGQVEKSDGSIGMWGNPIDMPSASSVRLSPKGIVPRAKYDSLVSARPELKKRLNFINSERETPLLGTPESEVVRGLLKPRKMANGGSLNPMSSDSVEVEGPSHANGGVQLPTAEVEGGETISGNFVFSEKLGFAKLHKPIAKAIGKIEGKPQTHERKTSLRNLKGQEEKLALQQELTKQQKGIPSELDNI